MSRVRALASSIERAWYGRARFPRGVEPLLGLASAAWEWGVARRSWRPRGDPVIPCVGVSSPTVGGSGKTPLVGWVARTLVGIGHRPAVVSRGYGGACRGPLVVDPRVHSAREVGDEPLCLAEELHVPVVVSRRRLEGVRLAATMGATVAVVDDAVMRPVSLALELMVVSAMDLVGNGKCLPAGPLRVPPAVVRRAHGVVVVVEPGCRPGWREAAHELAGAIPLLVAEVRPQGLRSADGERLGVGCLRGRPVVAWCGIARPWRFRSTLEYMGVDIRALAVFPDHHPYGKRDVHLLEREVARWNALPVTTAKDRARWPRWVPWAPYAVETTFDLEETSAARLKGLLAEVLGDGR